MRKINKRSLIDKDLLVSILEVIFFVAGAFALTIIFAHFAPEPNVETKPQTPCPLCAEACEIFHTTRIESEHKEAPNYYYYTYKCKACGNEFTLEIVQE